jgi:hypothetical protein
MRRELAASDVDRARAEKELAQADKELAAWQDEIDGAHQTLVERPGCAQARLDANDRVSTQ